MVIWLLSAGAEAVRPGGDRLGRLVETQVLGDTLGDAAVGDQLRVGDGLLLLEVLLVSSSLGVVAVPTTT